MNRRALLAALALGLSRPWWWVARWDADAAFLASLRRVFASAEDARQIGSRYLRGFRQPPPAAQLRTLAGILGGRGKAVPTSRAAFRRAIVNRRAADFARGATVVLEGVVLARSEAALCGLLVALEAARPA